MRDTASLTQKAFEDKQAVETARSKLAGPLGRDRLIGAACDLLDVLGPVRQRGPPLLEIVGAVIDASDASSVAADMAEDGLDNVRGDS